MTGKHFRGNFKLLRTFVIALWKYLLVKAPISSHSF